MTLGNKLSKLRREHNYTQEQLAELLGVSRQAISRWEADAAYPETEKLIRLGRLYHCSMDYLLKDEVETREAPPQPQPVTLDLRAVGYERVSKRRLWGLPLWHVNIGYGRVAKGVFAFGLTSRGIVSCGLASVGVLSIGVGSVGLLSIGALAVGLVALGSISVGVLAAGAVSVGLFSLGACAIGQFALGAAAIGNYAALGDHALGGVALGLSEARGNLFQSLGRLSEEEMWTVAEILKDSVPRYLGLFRDWFLWLAEILL